MVSPGKYLALLLSLSVTLAACKGTVGSSAGKEGGPCREDGSCDEGLACGPNGTCEAVTDACDGIDCSGHGTCIIREGLPACECDEGYIPDGLQCQAAPDPCEGIDCSGHGICDSSGAEVMCVCDEGYHAAGLDCIEDVADDRLAIGFTSSLNKVFFDDPTTFSGTMTAEGAVELARGEYEAVQLVLFPRADLAQVTVAVGDLSGGPNGSSVIGGEEIEINVVGYVNQLEARIEGDRVGWIPDPLLPNQPLDLRSDVLQPYLITVHAPAGTEAGTYRAPITISSGGQVITTAGLTVKVWKFTLPAVARFKTANLTGWGAPRSMWPERSFTDDERRAVMEAIAELGFRNRLPPTVFFASGLVSWNWNGQGDTVYGYPTHDGTTFNAQRTGELIDFMLARGANHFFLGATSDIFKFPDKVDRRHANLVAYLNDYYDFLVSRNLVDMAYVYNVDEPWGDAVQHARDTYTIIKNEVSQELRVMQNSNQNNATMFDNFLGYFDAFDINLGFYHVNDSDRYRTTYPDAFTDFWWNVNIWPDVHPNLFLEYPLFDARIIGPLSYVYRMQGFEYWSIASKGSIGNYHPVSPDEIRVQWDVDNRSLDGCLVYPATDGRIFSSLRYESFRDGMEDLDYLYLLEQLDPDNPLLDVPIITGLSEFSNDQDEVLDFRRQVAAAIEERL